MKFVSIRCRFTVTSAGRVPALHPSCALWARACGQGGKGLTRRHGYARMEVSERHCSLAANSLGAERWGAMATEPVTFFGQLLKRYREAARLSQSRLAQRAGFDHSYVSRLESGRRAPTREAIVRLAEALELSPADRDSLLAAAGFLPEQAEHLFGHEPVLSEVVELLQRQDVPDAIREDLRQLLALVVRQVKRALVGIGSDQDESSGYPSDTGWCTRWSGQTAPGGAW